MLVVCKAGSEIVPEDSEFCSGWGRGMIEILSYPICSMVIWLASGVMNEIP